LCPLNNEIWGVSPLAKLLATQNARGKEKTPPLSYSHQKIMKIKTIFYEKKNNNFLQKKRFFFFFVFEKKM